MVENQHKIEVIDLDVYYGNARALNDINIKIPANKVTALIGPSGCGKSTFLRSINRMNDLIDGVKIDGKVMIDETNVYSPEIDVVELRKKVGMIFQKSNPFPKSIYENVA